MSSVRSLRIYVCTSLFLYVYHDVVFSSVRSFVRTLVSYVCLSVVRSYFRCVCMSFCHPLVMSFVPYVFRYFVLYFVISYLFFMSLVRELLRVGFLSLFVSFSFCVYVFLYVCRQFVRHLFVSSFISACMSLLIQCCCSFVRQLCPQFVISLGGLFRSVLYVFYYLASSLFLQLCICYVVSDAFLPLGMYVCLSLFVMYVSWFIYVLRYFFISF